MDYPVVCRRAFSSEHRGPVICRRLRPRLYSVNMNIDSRGASDSWIIFTWPKDADKHVADAV